MPSHYVPIRDSRHRTACLALYKALRRCVRNIPLSDSLVYRAKDFRNLNPITYFIRKAFRRNKWETSPRLVVAALNNGYKFLDMLTKAQTPTSSQFTEVSTFLASHLSRAEARRARIDAKEMPNKRTPVKGTPPRPLLRLVKAETEDSPPEYEPVDRPRPKGTFRGPRHIPRLGRQMSGFPFIILREPQSKALSMRIQRDSGRAVRWQERILSLERVDQPAAEMEDHWDKIVQRTLVEEGVAEELADKSWEGRGQLSNGQECPDVHKGVESKYTDWVLAQRGILSDLLNKRRRDHTARAKALLNLVEEEKALAIKEAIEDGKPLPHRRLDVLGTARGWPFNYGNGR